MDLQARLCTLPTPLFLRSTLYWQSPLPMANCYSSNPLKRRRRTASWGLRTPVEITGRNGGYSPSVPSHKVTVRDRKRGLIHEFFVPEDQYILHTAESQNISLPFACRHDEAGLVRGSQIELDQTKSHMILSCGNETGCCTSCAVRVKSGQIRQPEALGISAELKSKGYALLCVGFPSSDIEVETQDEDEVYWLQFGRYFARGPVERDDYALELAMGDE